MNKVLTLMLVGSMAIFGAYDYTGSTTGSVTIVGGIIKAQNTEFSKKYKRKDCPVCKGQGWYISGDKITKVDCGYCEPDKKADTLQKSGTCKTIIQKN
jgi:hypothetical protein